MSKKLKFISLEPRILLDAAGLVSGSDALADSADLNAAFIESQLGQSPSAIAVKDDNAVQTSLAEENDDSSDALDWSMDEASSDSLASLDGKTLVVVDTSINGYQSLIDGLDEGFELLLIDGGEDGIEKLADYLENKNDLSSIHILSHGQGGELTLGTSIINAQTLGSYESLFSRIGAALSDSGDIFLYGCDVAQGTVGTAFVSELSSVLGADVAASDDLTGDATQGGDWDLEFTSGQIDSESLRLSEFDEVLGFSAVDHNGDGKANPVRMITWNVIGLDSNRPVTSGPDQFMVGFRVSADGDGLSGYTVKIVEDSIDIFGTGFTMALTIYFSRARAQ
jgi:hypothetical protein